ncbi:MAG: nucleotidyltransferase domain-containing protein [Erysipelotrichaceae bacterium]|nr:nucleotidyltransferase domain-containing protein [Erysipelotrichaceae bacterium]
MTLNVESLRLELYQNINDQIEYGNKLLDYRKGSLVLKKRRNELYYYLTYRDGNKVKTDYLGKLTKPNLKKIQTELDEGAHIREQIKKLQKSEKELRRLIKAVDKNYLVKEVYDVMDIIVIIRPILKAFSLGKVYLYGSYAMGRQDERSDINLYCDKPEKPVRELISKLEKETGKRVNVVTTTSKIPDSIKNEINNQKILIYGGY